MPYSAVPNAGQSLGQTRDQIRNNISDLKASLLKNHVDLDQGTDTGKHKFLQLPSIPNAFAGVIPTTSATEGGVYTKTVNSAPHTAVDLFYRRQSDGQEIQVTTLVTGTTAFASASTQTLLDLANLGTGSMAGYFNAYIATQVNLVSLLFGVYQIASTYNTFSFVRTTSPVTAGINFGSATGISVTFSGSNLRLTLPSGQGITYPATVTWTYTPTKFV